MDILTILFLFALYLVVSFPITVLIGKMMEYGMGEPRKNDEID